MLQGFKFGVGVCAAILVVAFVVSFFYEYGRCADLIDAGHVPPPGHWCEWVADFHQPA